MASNINRTVVSGNLTKDPELRETSTGVKVCELRLASNTPVKVDGKWDTKPNYFQITAWAGLGENCAKHLSKGSGIIVDGRLEWQKWDTEDGGTNSRVVIVADSVQFLGSPQGKKAEAASDGGEEKEDSDIPF